MNTHIQKNVEQEQVEPKLGQLGQSKSVQAPETKEHPVRTENIRDWLHLQAQVRRNIQNTKNAQRLPPVLVMELQIHRALQEGQEAPIATLELVLVMVLVPNMLRDGESTNTIFRYIISGKIGEVSLSYRVSAKGSFRLALHNHSFVKNKYGRWYHVVN
jgi:hypothetical protein